MTDEKQMPEKYFIMPMKGGGVIISDFRVDDDQTKYIRADLTAEKDAAIRALAGALIGFLKDASFDRGGNETYGYDSITKRCINDAYKNLKTHAEAIRKAGG